MIKNNSTINGAHIVSELSKFSRQKVIRICDLCGEEKEVEWNTIVRCRNKHNTNKDYCFTCSMKIYNSGENNPAKKSENREKISRALKGKSKVFKDGKNLRILDRKISSSGHVLKWSDNDHKHVQEHRLIYADAINKHHSKLEEIHHIDGNKINNNILNLVELTPSEHGALHSQLEKLAFDLVKNKLIIFDKENKKYKLSSNLEIEAMEQSLGFEHIAIKQNKNIVSSRLETDIASEFVRGVKIKIPLVASNMSTVINSDFYIKLYKLGAIGILHRANLPENIINEIKNVASHCDIVAASIGVEKDQFDFSKQMIKAGCNIITIDVAHGYSDTVLELAKKIKKYSPSTKIIIGNTTNIDMLYECYDFVDAIKVGIAQGFACETKNTAGCTEKQFSAILKFKNLAQNFGIPIISDGGIREPADFTKAIAAGASSVMAGSIFAACPESAAEIIVVDNKEKKLYAGMASEYVQKLWKGGVKSGTCTEGGIRFLDIAEPIDKLIEHYSGALRSGITYAGAKDIKTFWDNVKFVKVI